MLGRFLIDYFHKISDSLLARIYGLYKIRVGNQNPITFILMGNIAWPESEVIAQFDIKGSKYRRRVADYLESRAELDSNVVYKDLDFENFLG